jgi:hypothetical protein
MQRGYYYPCNSVFTLHVVCCLEAVEPNLRTYSCVCFALQDEVIQHVKVLPTEEQVKILIKILHILGRLPPAVKDACLIVMLNIVMEFLSEVLDGCVQEKEGTAGSPEMSSYIRDIATSVGVLGNGESLQVIAKKLLEYVVVSDGHLSTE